MILVEDDHILEVLTASGTLIRLKHPNRSSAEHSLDAYAKMRTCVVEAATITRVSDNRVVRAWDRERDT